MTPTDRRAEFIPPDMKALRYEVAKAKAAANQAAKDLADAQLTLEAAQHSLEEARTQLASRLFAPSRRAASPTEK